MACFALLSGLFTKKKKNLVLMEPLPKLAQRHGKEKTRMQSIYLFTRYGWKRSKMGQFAQHSRADFWGDTKKKKNTDSVDKSLDTKMYLETYQERVIKLNNLIYQQIYLFIFTHSFTNRKYLKHLQILLESLYQCKPPVKSTGQLKMKLNNVPANRYNQRCDQYQWTLWDTI